MLSARPPREEGHPAKAARADMRDKPKMMKTSLILERAVLGKLKALAFEEGKTVTELMAELVEWRLSKGPK